MVATPKITGTTPTHSSKDRPDPWNNHYFSLELDGEEVAHFQECTGFKSTAEVFQIQEGGHNDSIITRSGPSKWANITLKSQLSASTRLMEWRDSYITDEGFSSRPTTQAAVVMRALDGTELRRFTMVAVWPVSWTGPQLSSKGSALGVETLELAFDSLVIGDYVPPEPPPPPPPPEPPDEFDAGTVQFELNSSELSDEGRETLDELSEQLDAHPEVKEIWVEGHTCDLGSRSLNEGLSKDRAKSCKEYLEQKNPGIKFYSEGYAWDYPVAANKPANRDGSPRRLNRRTKFYTSARSGRRDGEIPYVDY